MIRGRAAMLPLLLLMASCGVERSAEPVDGPEAGTRTPPAEAGSAGLHPPQSDAGLIPAAFRGRWAQTREQCSDLSDLSRLSISDRVLRFSGFAMIGDAISEPAPRQFALRGRIEASGTPAEAHYSINAAGDVLTDEAGGGTVRVRCP